MTRDRTVRIIELIDDAGVIERILRRLSRKI